MMRLGHITLGVARVGDLGTPMPKQERCSFKSGVAPDPAGIEAGFHRGAPRLGEHSDEVLREAGFDAHAIDALVQEGAIARAS